MEPQTLARTLDRFALFVALDGLGLGEYGVMPGGFALAEIVDPNPESCPVRGRRLLGVARIDADGVRLLAALRGNGGRGDSTASPDACGPTASPPSISSRPTPSNPNPNRNPEPMETKPETLAVAEIARLALLDEIVVEATPNDTPVEGNASAIDPETDARVAAEILERLERGDEWAWATVRVSIAFDGFEAVDTLGGCSYADETDFRTPGGYFDDLRDAVLHEIVERLIDSGRYVADNEIGTVSHGTLRPFDLLERFAETLDALLDRRRIARTDTPDETVLADARFVGECETLLAECDALLALGDGEAFEQAEGVPDVLDALVDALDCFALPGFYFGSHPGDGSDFGFWADDEIVEQAQ